MYYGDENLGAFRPAGQGGGGGGGGGAQPGTGTSGVGVMARPPIFKPITPSDENLGAIRPGGFSLQVPGGGHAPAGSPTEGTITTTRFSGAPRALPPGTLPGGASGYYPDIYSANGLGSYADLRHDGIVNSMVTFSRPVEMGL